MTYSYLKINEFTEYDNHYTSDRSQFIFIFMMHNQLFKSWIMALSSTMHLKNDK